MEIRLNIPDRLGVIDAHHEQGGLVAAVLPIHYPRALWRAFGVLPVEVWGPPGADPSPAAAHLQSYLCPIVQHALGFYLAGGLDIVDLIVVPHACDSLQGLASVLLDFISPRQPVIPLYLPRGRRESDVDFLVDFRDDANWDLWDLVALQSELEVIVGRTVDVVDKSALRNPFRRKSILETREVLHVA